MENQQIKPVDESLLSLEEISGAKHIPPERIYIMEQTEKLIKWYETEGKSLYLKNMLKYILKRYMMNSGIDVLYKKEGKLWILILK